MARNVDFEILDQVVKGTLNLIESMGKFFVIWKEYGSKIGLGEEVKLTEFKSELIDFNI